MGVLLSLPLAGWLGARLGQLRANDGGLAHKLAIVLYVGTMPSLVAFFCWQRAVAQTRAQLPTFFMNLTPLFIVSMSALMLGEVPQLFHYVGLVLILGGIYLANRSTRAK